jgi:PAS domain S-box-containing protein
MSEQGGRGARRAGLAPRVQPSRARALFDRVPIGLYRSTRDGRILNANPALAALLGCASVNDLLAIPAPSFYLDPDQRAEQIQVIERTRAPLVSELRLRRKDGAQIWVRDTFSPVYDAMGRLRYFEGSLEDVTPKHDAHAAFVQSQQRLELALQSADLGMYDWQVAQDVVTISDRYATMLGYTVAEMELTREGWLALIHPDDRNTVLAAQERRRSGLPAAAIMEYRMAVKTGGWRWIQDRAAIVEQEEDGRPRRIVGFHLDITERKAAEARAGRVNRGLWMMVRCHEAIARAKDEASLLDQVCGILVDVGGYGVAWGGRAAGAAAKTVRLIARRGPLQHCLDDPTAGDADPPGDGPVGAAIRTAAVCHARDLAIDPRFPTWRNQALAGGLRSALVLPLMQRGRVLAELGLGYNEVDPFDDEEVSYLESLAQDITLGVAALRTDTERDDLLEAMFVSERRLREMLESVQLVVVGLDCEGGITFCNEYLSRVAGVRRPEMIGANWFAHFVPDYQQAQTRTAFDRMLGVASVSAYFESDLLTAHGERRTLSWNFTTTRDMNARVIGVTGIGEDITDRLRMAAARDELLTQVVAAHERLQSLSRQLVRVQEAERRSLARELHDEIGQSLTGLKIMIDMSLKSPAVARTNLPEALSLLNELIGKVRALSLDLRPGLLDDLGLLPALLWLFDRYTQQTNVQVSFHHIQLEDRRFSSEIETAAYRVVQEALTNVARHAQTDQAAVQVRVEETALYVEVRDQGRGFDAVAALSAGYAAGLSGLRERTELLSGRLVIESAPGVGTRVAAELPIT